MTGLTTEPGAEPDTEPGTGLVAEALERIERLDPGLCAFIEVWGDAALERARTVDRRLPLAGVPFAVKGPSGIRAYAAGRLIAAGAMPVGSTAVPGPGTYWQTWGQGRYGRTVNPYRADRTPGGSSAGSAVAVAAGMVPLATGSDGAGSVRIPAAWCGVFGLKTTNGLLPSPDRTGLASAGVLARSAAEARAYLTCVLGTCATGTCASGTWTPGTRAADTCTPGTCAPGTCASDTRTAGTCTAGRCTAGRCTASTCAPGTCACGTCGRSELRLPVPAVFSPDLGFADSDPEVVAVVRDAVERLVAAGVVRLVPPAPTAPPAHEAPLHPHPHPARTSFALLDPREAWIAIRGGDPAGPTGVRAAEVRAENDRRLDALFARTPLLLTPVTPNRPHGHEGPGDRYSTALTWAFNLSGHPAASIPAGFTSDGCPVGLHLVAERGADALLLDIAAAAEQHALAVRR
ncbi:amidase family protein [Streptomyces odonnellii]|uniref:amidase family protein n=1 Tax=Streptomyces odonnellii TaxID=1417980 RepID=UPI00099D4642|nr:amidase [Streptomyces odonnellii]